MKYTINELANSKGVSQPVREALLQMEAELEATNRQVEILSDALAESRREVAVKDEALKLALEALDIAQGLLADARSYHQPKMLTAYTAVKQALAAQLAPTVQEPEHIVHSNGRYSPLLTRMMNKRVESNVKQVIHLYDEPAPVQEPVAYRSRLASGNYAYCNTPQFFDNAEPLYTTPPAAQPAVPLTDEQLLDILRGIDSDAVRLAPGFKAFARAIEAAHGITAAPEKGSTP